MGAMAIVFDALIELMAANTDVGGQVLSLYPHE
jgi:hypothetical protein